MNAGRLALDNVDRFGEYTCLYFEGDQYTNVQMLRRAQQLAAVLAQSGIEPGDRVAVMMPNRPDVLFAFQAAWTIGSVIMPIMPQLIAREVRYILEHSEAKVILTSPDVAAKVGQAAHGLPHLLRVFVVGESTVEKTENIGPLMEAATPTQKLYDRAADDMAMLIYTSGTTGRPKGVMLSHNNLVSNAKSCTNLSKVEPFTRSVSCLPLAHTYGVLMMNIGNLTGFVTQLHTHFDAPKIIQSIQDFQVHRFSVVPTMLTALINLPERESYDVSTLQLVNSGGSSLPNEVRLEFEELFDCRVVDGYGQSESAPATTGYYDDTDFRPGSIGVAIPDVQVCIKDADDQTVSPGQTGEICIRGPNVMLGYWKNDQATDEAIVDGWLHSGDIGHMDQDGFVYLTDRKKDLIIKGGENISPREIEEAIYEHPAIAEVAVVGVADDKFGEDVCAVVALKPDAQATSEEIKEHAGQYVNKFKVPAHVVFMDKLPKSSVGKILKREVRDQVNRELKTGAKCDA